MLHEDARGDLVDHVDQLEQRVIRQVLLAEFHLGGVAGVGLAQNGVTVTRNDLAAVEGIPEGLLELFLGGHLAAELGHEVLGPTEDLLVCQTVQRSGQTVDTSREAVVGVGQGRSDQVGGVGGNVAGLMVGMQDEIHAGDIVIGLGHAHHVSEVATPVEVLVGRDGGVTLILHAVNVSSDFGKTGHQIVAVLVHRIPVIHLAHAFGILLGKNGFALHRQNSGGEHGHRMCVAGHGAKQVDYVLGNLGALFPVRDDLESLLHGRDITGQKKIPEALDIGVVATGNLGQGSKGFGNGHAPEPDAFHRIKIGDVGNQALNAAGAANGLSNGNVAELDVAELLDQTGGTGTMLLDFLKQCFLQCRHTLSPLVKW